MAWPCRRELWGSHLEAACRAYAAVAGAIARFEPVVMLARPQDRDRAQALCPGIEVLPAALDDSWTRDTGPTFLMNGEGGLAGVSWGFNAWGEKHARYRHDAELADRILDRLGLPRFQAPLVLEGGALHVDGEGTLITTDEVVLNPNRNPDLEREEAEALMRDYLGVERVIWLPGGLTDDMTDGHVDNLACFARPGLVLALASRDPRDSNYRALAENLERLRCARDAGGRRLEVIELEQPPERRLDGKRLSLSYINFYLANGAVVLPAFDAPRFDQAAFDTLAEVFPDRTLVQVPAAAIVTGGGGIHCITQQQPMPGRDRER